MFVLRAKAKLSDASNEFTLLGLAGEAVPESSAKPWTKSELGPASLVTLYPADGTPRALWVAPVSTPAPSGPALSDALWQWGEVRSGIAMVSAPIAEAFVPQMLNYESVGGVNFKKGCYPGQEVVARSQFRGTLKRRAYLVHCQEVMQAGDEVFEPADSEQPCGLVAQSAVAPSGGYDAIVSLQISAAHGLLHFKSAQGAPLKLLPLPYPLLDNI